MNLNFYQILKFIERIHKIVRVINDFNKKPKSVNTSKLYF